MNTGSRIPLELLAPAGTADIGIAAVDHGADAVYIGAPKFSARANAGSSMADIERLTGYAHRFKARVYLALNTILTDGEIPEAESLIRSAWEAGVDGLIFQDTGLLELDLPPIPLIASTQMHNTTPERVKFLEDAGVERVILARELSLDEIRAIRDKTAVELECFVHGALCVSYSGQCYMSQAAFGRSGNRGVCAQPCRLKYTLKDGEGNAVVSGKHLLSLKDFSLVDRLRDLADAGVTSFKIEGRYKDESYVKNVTAAYRLALDRLMADDPSYMPASSGHVNFSFEPDLSRTFNRGYTTYFLDGPDLKLRQGALDSPKSVGAPVGTVVRIENGGFVLSGEPVHNGDGMCFVSRTGELCGFRVERVENGRIVPNSLKGLEKGTALFRNRDHEFLKLLNGKTAERRIRMSMAFRQEKNTVRLSVSDEDGHSADVVMAASGDAANQPEKMADRIREQLGRTGTTMFAVDELAIDIRYPGFLPVSLINELRRDVLDRLAAERENGYTRTTRMNPSSISPVYPEKSVDFRANISNRLARSFYEGHGAHVAEDALETGGSPAGKPLMTTRYCIRREIGACLMDRNRRLDPRPPLILTDGKRSWTLEFDCKRCRMSLKKKD
jgi:putative protease